MLMKRRLLIFLVSTIVIAGIAAAAFFVRAHNDSPVPKSISGQLSFPIYYPDQKKLPPGYTLDTHSFTSPEKDVVLYTIRYSQAKKIVISVQKQPSQQQLQQFNLNYIPLHTSYQTKIGQADIGAYNNGKAVQTLASLPANNSASWMIITAPSDINQNDLKQALNSLKR